MVAALAELVGETRKQALDRFADEKIPLDRVSLVAHVKCRYQNQEHAVEVLFPGEVVDADAVASMLDRFHAVYEREYTYRLSAPVEIVGLHLVASAEVGKLELEKQPVTGASLTAALKGRRSVDYALEGIHLADIYDADRLGPGMTLTGPAIIEDPGMTVVVHPGNPVSIDDYGNIHIAVAV